MTITAHGMRKNANKARVDPQTGPTQAKLVKDTIVVCDGKPEPTNHVSKAHQCPMSQKATHVTSLPPTTTTTPTKQTST